MQLQDFISASAVMLPSLRNIQSILVMQGEEVNVGQLTNVNTVTYFTGHAQVVSNEPSAVKSLTIDVAATVKGIKGKANLNVRSTVMLSLAKYEDIAKKPREDRLDAYLEMLFIDLAHMQSQLLHATQLRVKSPSQAYSRLIGNQGYGSSLLIPSKEHLSEVMEQLTDVEKCTLEATTCICLSFTDTLYHIFNEMVLADKPQVAA